jgi:hypothetical protein
VPQGSRQPGKTGPQGPTHGAGRRLAVAHRGEFEGDE